MSTESPDIPHSIRKVYRRFERWRNAHTARLPVRDRLWAAAVDLAWEHGVSPTARALHLEYGKLKRLMESASPGGGLRWRRPRQKGGAAHGPPRRQRGQPGSRGHWLCMGREAGGIESTKLSCAIPTLSWQLTL